MKKQKKVNIPIPVPEPIYDDPDSPSYTQSLKKYIPSSLTASQAKSKDFSLQEQPQMKENVAYSSHQQQSTEAQAEEQC